METKSRKDVFFERHSSSKNVLSPAVRRLIFDQSLGGLLGGFCILILPLNRTLGRDLIAEEDVASIFSSMIRVIHSQSLVGIF